MAKYFIEITDTAEGINFKSGAFEEPDGSAPDPAKTPAGRMFSFLAEAAQDYVTIINMDIPQTLAYVKAKSDKPITH